MDLGIDFGTTKVTIVVPGRGVVLKEPSVIAMNSETGRIVACGQEAYDMLGRTPASIRVVRPMTKGVVSDYDAAEKMLRYYIGKVCSYRILKPRAVLSVPTVVTEVEQRSLVEAVSSTGLRRVVLLEEALAAAVGAGLPVTEPHGSLIVDFGGGTTDAAVISLQGVAAYMSERIGGDDIDEAIIRYLQRAHSCLIGPQQAERIKKTIGGVMPRPDNPSIPIRGRQQLSGLPIEFSMTAEEIRPIICREVDILLRSIQRMMEQTPPDMLGDIYTDGMTITGGGALLFGLADYAAERLNTPCHVADHPDECTAMGTGEATKYVAYMTSDVFNASNFSYRLSERITN